MVKLASLRHKVSIVFEGVTLGELLAQSKYLFIEVDQEGLNRDAKPTFRACFDLLGLDHVPFQAGQAVNLVRQLRLDAVEHSQGILWA